MSETQKITKEMVEVIKSYIQKDDELRDLRATEKEVKLEMQGFKEKINLFLDQSGLPAINTSKGGIIRKKRTKRGGINRAYLLECFQNCEILKDEQAEGLVKYIYDNRSAEEIEELKRVRH